MLPANTNATFKLESCDLRYATILKRGELWEEDGGGGEV